MQTYFLAQIIGPIFTIATLGFLLHKKFYKKIIKDFEKHEGLTYFVGIFVMLIGLIMVLNHNIWEFSPAGLITFFGWASLIKGAIFLIMPNALYKISYKVMKNKICLNISMKTAFLLGIYLTWFGFFG
jgi:predicted tellurium resistance membrane protein TerC